MGSTRPSMQELIGRRRRAGFVGRVDERAAFRRNLELPPEDERHRFLFHVHGDAGVGKTFLVRELEQTAREAGALTAYVDEGAASVPEAMTAMARQFAAQGRRFKELERMLAAHRERRHEAEAALLMGDPAEPDGPSAGSLAVARAAQVGLGMVPLAGAFAAALDADTLAQSADRLRARFRSQEDAQLVLSPEQVLTPVLLSELAGAADAAPWVVIFLDTYERTGLFLDPWLHDVMTTDRYGNLPADIVVVTSGQHPFGTARWGGFADFMTDVPLGPFTEAEARGLLADKGVRDEPVVAEVLRLTGGLPVLVSTLAATGPDDPERVGDPSATAVERFLKWERDPVRRAAALAGALPRQLDEDVFRTAVDCPEDDARSLFAWLMSMPFVTERVERVQYHDVVRAPMLRLQRLRSPNTWRERHTRLAEAFGGWREECEADLPPDMVWREERWRQFRLAESYHLLCARPQAALPAVLRDFVDACGEGDPVARRWAQTLVQAGEDADAKKAGEWGSELLAGLDGGGIPGALGTLLAKGAFDDRARAEVHRLRGVEFGGSGDHATALTEFDRAIELDRESAPAYVGRAIARAHRGDHIAAIADLDRADALAPGRAATLSRRGDYHRLAGDYDSAIRDLDRAVELDPTARAAWAARGATRYLMGDLDAAQADLDRSLELDAEYSWALVRRARVWRSRGEQERRLADLDRAVTLEPDAPWVLCERGDALVAAGRHGAALADYDRALELNREYASAYASRGACRAAMGEPAKALADLDRAIELKPEYSWALWQRAKTHLALGSRPRAAADVERALELDPDHWEAQVIRARIDARRLVDDEAWDRLSLIRDRLEASLSAPDGLGRLPMTPAVPDETAGSLEAFLGLAPADRADLTQRLTEILALRDSIGGIPD
ncbi:tetratricopeptide repeat protein [Streptomyces sp. NBC_00631]|uniref:tetratricopeptide repeat protein n=1 Tax=Streptomyces sp. NBC_00631 TaxID=2975793 RepID=UPI0030E4C190